MQVDVGQKQAHQAAFGDGPGFVKISLSAVGTAARAEEKPQPGAGEEAAKGRPCCRSGGGRPRPVPRRARHGRRRQRSGLPLQRSPTQAEVVYSEVEASASEESLSPAHLSVCAVRSETVRRASAKPSPRPRSRRARENGSPCGALGGGEQRVAIPEASHR